MPISVIIPALNESANITRAIDSALLGAAEVIVVDGGSSDCTQDMAASLGARVMASAPGRAVQMNAGASIATGDALLFLHADTVLPVRYSGYVREILARPGTVAGAFEFKADRPVPGIALIERLANFRSRVFGLPYGDQGIFMTAAQFRRVGGYKDMPIMEDFELMRRLGRLGRIEIAPAAAVTSARRWEEAGVMKMTLVNQAVILGYMLGVPVGRVGGWRR